MLVKIVVNKIVLYVVNVNALDNVSLLTKVLRILRPLITNSFSSV